MPHISCLNWNSLSLSVRINQKDAIRKFWLSDNVRRVASGYALSWTWTVLRCAAKSNNRKAKVCRDSRGCELLFGFFCLPSESFQPSNIPFDRLTVQFFFFLVLRDVTDRLVNMFYFLNLWAINKIERAGKVVFHSKIQFPVFSLILLSFKVIRLWFHLYRSVSWLQVIGAS